MRTFVDKCPPGGHERGDFLAAIRTRCRPAADIEIGHRTITVCHLGVTARRVQRPFKWEL